MSRLYSDKRQKVLGGAVEVPLHNNDQYNSVRAFESLAKRKTKTQDMMLSRQSFLTRLLGPSEVERLT